MLMGYSGLSCSNDAFFNLKHTTCYMWYGVVMNILIKYSIVYGVGRIRNSGPLLVGRGNESRYLVFWPLKILTGLRDRARGLVA